MLTISDGSEGESHTVGNAESESEAEIAGKTTRKTPMIKISQFRKIMCSHSVPIFHGENTHPDF